MSVLSPKADIRLRAADCDFIVCYGRAKPTDKHLASKIHCVDWSGVSVLLLRRAERPTNKLLGEKIPAEGGFFCKLFSERYGFSDHEITVTVH
jgi:hypothetical protein